MERIRGCQLGASVCICIHPWAWAAMYNTHLHVSCTSSIFLCPTFLLGLWQIKEPRLECYLQEKERYPKARRWEEDTYALPGSPLPKGPGWSRLWWTLGTLGGVFKSLLSPLALQTQLPHSSLNIQSASLASSSSQKRFWQTKSHSEVTHHWPFLVSSFPQISPPRCLSILT